MRSDQYGLPEDNCSRTKHVSGNYCVSTYNKKLLYCDGIKKLSELCVVHRMRMNDAETPIQPHFSRQLLICRSTA